MKRSVRSALVLLAALAASAQSSSAADSSEALKPYLLISTRYFFASIDSPSAPDFRESALFLTHGGGYFASGTTRTGTGVPRTSVIRAIATTRQLRTLRSRLNTLGINRMTSCEQTVGAVVEIIHDLVWTSIDGQRNAFTVVTGTGTTGLPDCPAKVLEALDAINSLGGQVRDNPGTEILVR